MDEQNNSKQDDIPLEAEVLRVNTGAPLQDPSSKKGFQLSFKVKVIVAMVFIGLLALTYVTSVSRKDSLSKSNSVDLDPSQAAKRKVLPDYSFIDADKKAHLLTEYTGKVLIISFWASWCSPCLLELPTFAQLYKKYHDQGLEVLAVNAEDDDLAKKFAHNFWERNKFEFLSFFDPEHVLAEAFDVEILPSNFVVDRSGRLVFSGFGATDWNSPQVQELIESLLMEKTQEVKTRPSIPQFKANKQKAQSQDEIDERRSDDMD